MSHVRRLEILDERIQVLTGAFDAAECDALIRLAEGIGFHDAPITTGAGFVMAPDIRNNTRVMLDDVPRAAALWDRLAMHVPARDGRFRAVGLNERFRFYRYEPGQQFDWHRDGAFVRRDGDRSLYTLIVYLNDGFTGGTTDFSLPQLDEPLVIEPERGMVLLFQHHLRHRGAPVISGVKYALRTDVMYRHDAA
jgi:predicted 2-oxoglutarate/Fe(II)-dependent dioxygenase YbiX